MKLKLTKSTEPLFFLRFDPNEREEGPLTLESLRQLAAEGALTPEAEIRRQEETGFHKLADDAPLMADLWPEEAPDPAEIAADPVPSAPEGGAEEESLRQPETGQPVDPGKSEEDQGFDVGETLRENVDRDRVIRESKPAEPIRRDPVETTRAAMAVLRRVIGGGMVIFGITFWSLADKEDVFSFGNYLLIGLLPLVAGVFLLITDLLKLFTGPIGAATDYLFQGSGGGSTADYWTADSLMDQGEYRKALDEYRKILWNHPRELKAHLEAVRAAKAMDDKKEIEKIEQLATKNLRSKQDREMFFNSLERIRKS